MIKLLKAICAKFNLPSDIELEISRWLQCPLCKQLKCSKCWMGDILCRSCHVENFLLNYYYRSEQLNFTDIIIEDCAVVDVVQCIYSTILFNPNYHPIYGRLQFGIRRVVLKLELIDPIINIISDLFEVKTCIFENTVVSVKVYNSSNDDITVFANSLANFIYQSINSKLFHEDFIFI